MSDSNTRINLFIPDWQGYALDPSPADGAWCLKNWIFADTQFTQVDVPSAPLPPTKNNIVGFSAIDEMLKATYGILAAKAPSRCFTLGGT